MMGGMPRPYRNFEGLRRATEQVPTTVGESVRRIDTAWPGNHTRRMYDDLSKRQASILAQLRTGMTPLNGYLHNIKAVESNLCECGEAVESREHFVFRCVRWSEQRKILGMYTGEDKFSRFFFFSLNHTAFKLNSLWHVGYLLDDFYGLHICSRASLPLYNPARRPDSTEPPRLLGSMPSYFSVAVVLHHPPTLRHSPLPLNRPRPSGPAAQHPMSRLCYVPSPASCLLRSSP